MKYDFIKGNLFSVGKEYIAHCISSDCIMGKGIAVDVERNYKIKKLLLDQSLSERGHPTCILTKNVFNLITKEYCYGKPTYKTLRVSLQKMREIMYEENIMKVSMPMIGVGLDKLNWNKVEDIIKDVFSDTDFEIVVYYL